MTGLQQSMQKSFFSKNCPHITAVKVVVGVQLFQDCSWRRKKAPENPHMMASVRHKFRPSVNVDEFDSLKGSSNPSNATGTTSSVVMRANLQQNNCSIRGYARGRAPVASYTWQYPPPLAFWFTWIPVELCVSTLHKVF